MGMLVFYKKFIPNFAMLAEPIVELTRWKMNKYSEVKQDQRHNTCLLVLKNKLSMTHVLKHHDLLKDYLIKTDTSQVGLGLS